MQLPAGCCRKLSLINSSSHTQTLLHTDRHTHTHSDTVFIDLFLHKFCYRGICVTDGTVGAQLFEFSSREKKKTYAIHTNARYSQREMCFELCALKAVNNSSTFLKSQAKFSFLRGCQVELLW